MKDWLEGKHVTPVLVEIDPVNYCNAACPWCIYSTRSNRARFENQTRINYEALYSAITGMKCCGVKAINWTGSGEPTLYPKLDKLVEHAHHYDISQGLFTNCVSERHGVDPSFFEWIRVSLTEKYLEGISKPLLAEYLAQTTVGICMNLTPDNLSMVDEMCRGACDLGVHYFQIRPALQQSYHDCPEIVVPSKIKEYETEDFKVYLSPYKFSDYRKPKPYSLCRAGQFECVLDCYGNVRVCNYHLDEPEYAIGNICEESFESIVERIPRETSLAANCQTCCKNHVVNAVLDELLQVENVNFI